MPVRQRNQVQAVLRPLATTDITPEDRAMPQTVSTTGTSESVQVAEQGLILRAIVGSRGFGIATEESDTDYVAVCLLPPDYVYGLEEFSTVEDRGVVRGQRAVPGSVEGKTYSAQQFCRMTLGGNLGLLIALYAHPDLVTHLTVEGEWLREARQHFVSKRFGHCALSFVQEKQRTSLRDERRDPHMHRPELLARYTFDVKFAANMLRNALQGLELLRDGQLSVPLSPSHQDYLRAIRAGQVSLADCVTHAADLESQLLLAMRRTHLPENGDRQAVNRILIRAYSYHYSGSPSPAII